MRLGLAVGQAGSAKVLSGLPLLTRSLQEHSVLAERGPEGQLIKGDDLAAGLENSVASLLSHVQGADGHLGHLEDPEVVGDGSNADDDLVGVGGILLQDDLVELGLSTTGQESVELDEEPEVDVLGLR